MKSIFKNLLIIFVNTITLPIKNKRRIARIYSFFSKRLFSPSNSLEYDKENDVYWCKHNQTYLYAESLPTFNFSQKKLYEGASRICCKKYIPTTNDVIVDVGAGVGTEFMFFIDKIADKGMLYNIEASPNTFTKLELLSKKNKIQTCKNFNLAISSSEGEIWIEEDVEHQKAQINTNKKGNQVKAMSLDNFIKENNIGKINYLKINIEGAEYEMIDGMTEAIKITENIAVSCHDFLFEVNDRIRNKILVFLKENGFTIFENETGHQVVDSWIYGRRN